LALARLTGDEHHYIQLVRAARSDLGTAAARTLSTFKRKLARAKEIDSEASAAFAEAADIFARNDLAGGAIVLAGALRQLPNHYFSETAGKIVYECALRLEECGADRTEYLLLALHALTVGWQE
jgi:hypothetical protein